ncbi:MAG TPA: hypothetical protein VIM64_25440 [Puia sp.]
MPVICSHYTTPYSDSGEQNASTKNSTAVCFVEKDSFIDVWINQYHSSRRLSTGMT